MKEWLCNPVDFRRVLNLAPRNEKSNQIDGFLWPISVDYYSQLNPIFLHHMDDIELFKYAPVWLIRDGLVPLIWFFKKNPSPPRWWVSQMLVKPSLASFVPDEWRRFFGTYRIRQNIQQEESPKRILLVGLMTDVYCSQAELNYQIKKLAEKLGKSNLKAIEVSAILPGKFSCLLETDKITYHFEYALKICNYFGTQVKTLKWNQFLRSESFQESMIVDLNDHILCSDNALIHHALSFGGRLPSCFGTEQMETAMDSQYMAVSSYHGFEVRREISAKMETQDDWSALDDYLKFEKKIYRTHSKNTSYIFPWPESLMNWARSSTIQKRLRGSYFDGFNL